MTIAANIYCSIADVQDILSASGVTLSSDDAPPTAYGGAIAKAGNQIDKYCFRRYDPANLAQSDLVKDWAAIIAAYYLRTRRGNPAPPGLAIMYEDAVADLIEIKKALNDIPGIAPRKSYVPVFSKMRATQRPFPRVVVEVSQGSKATGDAENYHRHSDPWDTFGWNINAFLDLAF